MNLPIDAYAQTKIDFLNRCAAILPAPLHCTLILAEIGDAYPDLAIAERDLIDASAPESEIMTAVEKITTRDIITLLVSYMPDAIMAESEDEESELDMTQTVSDEIIDFARLIDPTESNIAAEVRDTIRDNYDVPNLHI